MGLPSDAIQSGNVKTVDINQHDWSVFYSNEHQKAIGVRVFAIVSPHAATIAHIGPNIHGSSDPGFVIELAQRLTRNVVSTCIENQSQFLPNSKTHIVCATVNNAIIAAPK